MNMRFYLIKSMAMLCICNGLSAQTNLFPLYSFGGYTGGSGDMTNVTNPQLKLSGTYAGSGGYVRVVHVSADPDNSVVYNYETNKNVYWGEPTDGGAYIFRGRNLLVGEGNVGIGTNIPQGKLHIVQNNNIPSLVLEGNTTGWGSGMYFRNTAPTGNVYGIYASSWGSFNIVDVNAGVDRIYIGANGNVGVNTHDVSDAGYKFFVGGAVRARKVRVDQDTWPDYVFGTGYTPRPLAEVESFIKKYQHLPDVPSAAEVKKEGIDLGEGQTVLLKKIEELTLYVIDINKKNEQLQKQVNDLNAAMVKMQQDMRR